MEQRHTKHTNKETNQCLKDVVTPLIQMIKYRRALEKKIT